MPHGLITLPQRPASLCHFYFSDFTVMAAFVEIEKIHILKCTEAILWKTWFTQTRLDQLSPALISSRFLVIELETFMFQQIHTSTYISTSSVVHVR